MATEKDDMTIRKSIRVERSPEISFKVFCEEIGAWWPGGFSGKDSRLSMETRIGGRFFETRADGTEYEIGRLTAYQPPKVVAFTWRAELGYPDAGGSSIRCRGQRYSHRA